PISKTTRIAQINVVDVDEVLARKSELTEAAEKEIEAEGYDLFVLVITNILESDSTVIALGSEAGVIEKAFDVALDEDTALLKGVVSRKKQVVPNITKALGLDNCEIWSWATGQNVAITISVRFFMWDWVGNGFAPYSVSFLRGIQGGTWFIHCSVRISR